MRTPASLWIVAIAAALGGPARADSVSAKIEVSRESFATIDQCEQLKLLLPKYRDWINSYIVELKLGMTHSYQVLIRLDQEEDPIRSAYVVKPNAEIVPLVKSRPGRFEFGNDGPGVFYASVDDLAAHWPSGAYDLHVTFADGRTETLTTVVPDYDATPIPDPVGGTLSANAAGQLVLDWNTVEGAGEFQVWCTELKKMRDVFDSDDLYYSHPSSHTTLIAGAYAGKGDYLIGVHAETDVTSGEFGVEFKSQANWFSFRKPLPDYQDMAVKCTVSANKDNIGSMTFSGQLTAIEADFLLAGSVRMKISCATPLDSIGLEFPVDEKTLKKGVFSSTVKNLAARTTSSFRYDTRTHAFVCTLKGFDLTGLSCPITVDIDIGDYYDAAIELDEDVVNGKKTCPPQLIRGLADSLVIAKSLFKPGKLVGMDTFSASGVFTLGGEPVEGLPLVITLGTQTFTVGSDLFIQKKPGVYACLNAGAAEGNGVVSATLDVNKCSFTVAIKNASIEAEGMTAFGLTALGYALSGFAEVDLGAMYAFWDLTLYDQPGEEWFYNTRYGTTEVTVYDSGGDSFQVYENEYDAEASLYYEKEADGAASFQRLVIDSDDLGGEISLNLGVTMWPSQLRPGQMWLAASSMDGEMRAFGETIDITNGTASSKTIVGPKMTRVKVPAGTYDTVKFDETWTMSGAMEYDNEVVGKITLTITQSNYAAPGVGVVKRVRRFVMRATVYGKGSFSDGAADTYVLSQ